VDDEGGEGDKSAVGSVSRRRRFRRSQVATPPVAPHTDNRVLIVPCGSGYVSRILCCVLIVNLILKY
jgi:hypothetical protein